MAFARGSKPSLLKTLMKASFLPESEAEVDIRDSYRLKTTLGIASKRICNLLKSNASTLAIVLQAWFQNQKQGRVYLCLVIEVYLMCGCSLSFSSYHSLRLHTSYP